MAHPNRLQNARILIFGGTSGIGFGIASMALSNGAYVTISGSAQPKVDAKVQELQSLYPHLPADHVTGYACDLADSKNLEVNLKKVFDQATKNGEVKFDHIAFTAGDALKLPKIQDVTVEEALAGFTVRFLASSFIGKLVSTGRYLHVSSASSLTLTSGTNTAKPFPGWSFGASWGAAVEGLMRGLAVDLKPIRVNCVAPGAIYTPILEKFMANVGDERANEIKTKSSLVGTWGTVEDCAEAYGWFMRDCFVTGTRADTNGGRMLA